MYVKNSAGGGRKYSKANLAKQEEEEEAGRSSTPGYLYYSIYSIHCYTHNNNKKSRFMETVSRGRDIPLDTLTILFLNI